MAKGILTSGGGGATVENTSGVAKPLNYLYVDAEEDVQISNSNLGGDSGTSNGYPVYIKNGVFTAYTGTLSNAISGTASTANKIKGTATTSKMFVGGFQDTPTSGSHMDLKYNASVYTQNTVLYNACWNDYAEYQKCEDVPSGTCVAPNAQGILEKSYKRLQPLSAVISDTYGMAIGSQEDAQPIALCGKVLAYPDKQMKVGDVVCSGRNGTISKMSRLEIILFPDRILGIVCEIPTYTTWNGVEVNNRIWIQL